MGTENEEEYTLTPWGCLMAVLHDYGVDVDFITARIGEHMVNDFMDLLVKRGYLEDKRNERG